MQPKIYSLEFHCTVKGDFLFCSADSALLKRLGYTQETLSLDRLGINCESLSLIKNFLSEARSTSPATSPSSLHPKAEIPVKTLTLQKKSGKKIQFSAFCSSLAPIQEVFGEDILEQDLSALTLFLVDTEPFAQAETELRKNEEKYRELVENANSIILRWDKHGFITYFNEFAQRLFGYTEDEIIGQHVMDTIVPRTESTGRDLSPLMNDICEHPENYESNVNENCTKEGKRVWINWTNKILKDDAGVIIGALSIGTDITRQKQMEEELRHKHKMDAIGQLAGGMAHDFNNMLHGLMGFAEIIQSRLEDEKLKGFAGKIITIARQSSELTGQLLAFARKGQYQLVTIDIHHEVAELINMLEHMLDKKINIESSLMAMESCIEGDSTQIKNSLLNLALNAKDAMPEGGTLKFTSANIAVTTAIIQEHGLNVIPGDYLKLDVVDTGDGISDEIRDHIFEPFFTTKKRDKGTGMGLAVVYGTVANHGGEILIESQLGKGCCFSLYLPVCRKQPEIVEEIEKFPKGNGRIMLVDDEEAIRTYAQILFAQHDYQIETCSNGFEAVERYQQSKEPIDLVILDMIMPKMGGQEAFRQLKAFDPNVKVVIASGYGLDNEIQAIIDEGAIDFIQKPFTIKCLSKILNKAIS